MEKTLADSCFGNVLSNDLLRLYEHRASNQIIYTYVPKDIVFFYHCLFCCSPPLSQDLGWKWVAFSGQWDEENTLR